MILIEINSKNKRIDWLIIFSENVQYQTAVKSFVVTKNYIHCGVTQEHSLCGQPAADSRFGRVIAIFLGAFPATHRNNTGCGLVFVIKRMPPLKMFGNIL